MREVTLRGRQMATKEQAHRYLRQMLGLPSWYGGNLDALHDCLTAEGRRVHITAKRGDTGALGTALIKVLQDAAAQNPNLRLTIED